jgi:cell division GTPase FtsZ
MNDVPAVLGTDLTMAHAYVPSAGFESARSAAVAAVLSLPTHFDGLRRVQGIVTCVMVGTPALALAAVKTVAALLRGEGSEDIAVICGACVDPAMGKSIKVMLRAK